MIIMKRQRSIAGVAVVLAAIVIVLDSQFDLGAFHDLVDFISGILIGISGTLMVLSRAKEDQADEA